MQYYLKNLLPKKWKVLPLINVSEKKLIHTLSISKIFLSFSNFEGVGLPPIEAALSGNKVIGYVGGGGSEYWKKPLFHKVFQNNLKYHFFYSLSVNLSDKEHRQHQQDRNPRD